MKRNDGTDHRGAPTTSLPQSSGQPPAPQSSPLGWLLNAVRASWKPKPLRPPTVDPELENLSPIERCAEVLRFQFLRLEHALFSCGTFREYLKFNLRLAVILVIPALFIAPILTFLFGELATLSAFLFTAVENFLKTLIDLVVIGLILTGVFVVIAKK